MITNRELGWMAGVLDMKGRVYYKNNKMRATPQAVLAVETKQMAVIRELSRLTGTNPELKKAQPLKDFMRRGCIDHCPGAHVHQLHEESMMPEVARWTVTGVSMAVVLYSLLPYLRVDRDLELAMQSCMKDAVLTGRGSVAAIRALIRLRDLGWEIPDEFADFLPPDVPATAEELTALIADAVT